MQYVWAILLALLNLVFLALTVLGLPGIWFMLIVAGFVMWLQVGSASGGAHALFGWPSLAAAFGIALGSEIAEFFASVYGTKKAGGTKHGAIGALVGSIIGCIVGSIVLAFIPVLGTIVGACAGAALGAIAMELRAGRTMNESLTSGVGAGLGRLAGTGIKVAAGLVVWLILTIATFL